MIQTHAMYLCEMAACTIIMMMMILYGDSIGVFHVILKVWVAQSQCSAPKVMSQTVD